LAWILLRCGMAKPAAVLRVLLIDDNVARAAAVRVGLEADGCVVVGHLQDVTDLVVQVRRAAADVIVCDIDNPSRDEIESMRALQRDEPRPVVMFVDQSDPASIGAAMQAGVAAYVIEGLAPHRVRSVVDVAIARFGAHQALRAELAEAREALAERKVIERAKGILMRARGLDEEAAFRTLRTMAMEQGQRLVDVAQGIVTVGSLLRPRRAKTKL
jgi:response regulator NasT